MRFKLALNVGARVLDVIATRLEAGDEQDKERAALVRMAEEILKAIVDDEG